MIPIVRVDCDHDKRWLQNRPAHEETDHSGNVDIAGTASSGSTVNAELEEGMEGEAEAHWLAEMGSGLSKAEIDAWRKANHAI